MSIIIFLTSRAPYPLTDELILAGHRVFEVLAISEVLALMEEHPEAQIIIGAEVGDERAKVIQQRYPTMRLKGNTTLKDVLWELELISADSPSSCSSLRPRRPTHGISHDPCESPKFSLRNHFAGIPDLAADGGLFFGAASNISGGRSRYSRESPASRRARKLHAA